MLPNHSSNGGQSKLPGHRRPADQRAPGEDQPEPRLRPPGDALHEGIGGDRRDADQRDDRGDAIELEQDDEADQAQQRRSAPTPSAPTPGRWRAAAGASARPAGRGRGRRCRCRRSPRCASRTRRARATGTGPSARRRRPARRSTRTASRAARCRSAGRAASATHKAASRGGSAPMNPRRSLSGTMSVECGHAAIIARMSAHRGSERSSRSAVTVAVASAASS